MGCNYPIPRLELPDLENRLGRCATDIERMTRREDAQQIDESIDWADKTLIPIPPLLDVAIRS